MPELAAGIWVFVVGVTVLAGVVKGTIGFAMPMIMISGLATALSPELALAGLLMSTLVSNATQALRNGVRLAVASALAHWRYILILWVVIALSAQLVTVLSQRTLFLVLGVPVTVFAILQLAGWRLRIRDGMQRVAEAGVAVIAGFVGGLTGVWGPPTVAYLTALETEKSEQMRVQGVIYGTGAVVLVTSHIASGVLSWSTWPFSAVLVLPGLIGLLIGFRIQDQIDQDGFRKVTLIFLVIAGLNLIRRAWFG